MKTDSTLKMIVGMMIVMFIPVHQKYVIIVMMIVMKKGMKD